ncbi:abasic site processing protein HMCES [Brienomyrus brachyistius]|uniref:abasic site processing protein HMCES n=1 Tax=Brienomyrus brachyistius TaxID=42636 RepID=UPI0020B17BDD|nr:abasic site processing protein HMCES [Brienomyrus brachyistius]XP_048877941.1 abasic site processing protein HMCES [Brienomyrus brachyistius]
MCGRTACTLAPDEISRASRYRSRAGQYRRPRWRDGDSEKYRPSYNKSPQSLSPVLLSQKHFDKAAPADECVIAAMRWGLVPSWFRESDPSKMQYSTSNCRSESLLEKKSYKEPLLKGQRCVILADGFYEWQQSEKKQPFFIYFPQSKEEGSKEAIKVQSGGGNSEEAKALEEDDRSWKGWKLLTMAGLFDSWTPPSGGEKLYTYTIITVNASPGLQSIHHRMPAVLDGEEEVRKWLDYGEVRSLDALKLLQPKDKLTFHPVSSFVNNARNNSPECLQPFEPGSKKTQTSASSKAMMSWLQKATPEKKAEPKVCLKRKRMEEEGKQVGPLHKWLQKNA